MRVWGFRDSMLPAFSLLLLFACGAMILNPKTLNPKTLNPKTLNPWILISCNFPGFDSCSLILDSRRAQSRTMTLKPKPKLGCR